MKTDFQRCTRCILSAAFPRISFDDDGVCNYCRKGVENDAMEREHIDKARRQIQELFAARDRKPGYDAIVCYSGGKDSTYTLKLAVEKYQLKVLAFTLDNGYFSQTAWDNIHRVVSNLGIDHWVFRPSKKHYSTIARASATQAVYRKQTLTRISAICNSCISMVNTTALRIAIEKKIPFILAGFTLGQIPANSIVYKNHYKFLAESREESLNKLRQSAGAFIDDYLCIEEDVIDRVESYPYNVNILCVEDLSEDEIRDAVAPLGWKSPGDVDGCSSNCRLNAFNNHVHEKIFDYNPYEMELSHLIRKGLMRRDEALKKINDRPVNYVDAIMQELGIGSDDIQQVKWVYEQQP